MGGVDREIFCPIPRVFLNCFRKHFSCDHYDVVYNALRNNVFSKKFFSQIVIQVVRFHDAFKFDKKEAIKATQPIGGVIGMRHGVIVFVHVFFIRNTL